MTKNWSVRRGVTAAVPALGWLGGYGRADLPRDLSAVTDPKSLPLLADTHKFTLPGTPPARGFDRPKGGGAGMM